jgi:hypothetical protein
VHLFDPGARLAYPKLHSDAETFETDFKHLNRQHDLYPRLRWPGEPGTNQAENGPAETP